MANHPNRSRAAGSPERNPTAAEVRAARFEAGLTQAQAATLVHATPRNWQQWEDATGGTNARRMHPGLWDLFRIRAGLIPAAQDGKITGEDPCRP